MLISKNCHITSPINPFFPPTILFIPPGYQGRKKECGKVKKFINFLLQKKEPKGLHLAPGKKLALTTGKKLKTLPSSGKILFNFPNGSGIKDVFPFRPALVGHRQVAPGQI